MSRSPRKPPRKKEYIGVPFETKAVDDAARTFEGYSATWDLDLGNDRILRGAFAKTVGYFKAGRKAIALLDSHNYGSVMHGYGDLVDAGEDERGLWSKWRVIDGVDGERVLDRIRGGVVRKMSIGYYAEDAEMISETVDGVETKVRLLKEINWEETSLVLFPMNPAADVDLASVKALLNACRPGDPRLTPDEKSRLLADLATARDQIDAILTEHAVSDPASGKGLAPDDPQRLAMEATLRELTISQFTAVIPARAPSRPS